MEDQAVRQCKKCREIKSVALFAKHHPRQCKECKASYMRAYMALYPKDKLRAKKRKYYTDNWRAIRIYQNDYARSNRDNRKANARARQRCYGKVRAGEILRRAIKDGKVKRQPCEVCGKPSAQGHHGDYSKPLDVRWLCFRHHSEVHGKKHFIEDRVA